MRAMKLTTLVAVLSLVLASATMVLAHNGMEHVMGTVSAMTNNSVTVQTVGKDAKSVTVAIVPATKFAKSGAAATIKDLKVGDRVMIEAKDNAQDVLEADTVTFGKQPAPKSGQ